MILKIPEALTYYQNSPTQNTPLKSLDPAKLSRGRLFSNFGETNFSLADLAKNPEKLNNLESDLSFIYYSPQDNSLTLVRDNCGATPLFYAPTQSGRVVCAFDLPTLLAALDFTPVPDELALYDFLATHYRYVFRVPSRTFYQGIFQVPAGHYVKIKGQDIQVLPWLKLTFDATCASLSPQEAADFYLETLDENVQARLKALAGEKFTFTVSSGLDSATVTSLAQRYLDYPLDVWYMAYGSVKNTPYDETPGVLELVKAKGFQLHRLDLAAPSLLADTEKLISLTSAPIITVTWLAHFKLAQAVKSAGFDFLFSGLGGDESLAGEFEHFFLFFADLLAEGKNELLERETEAWIKLHNHPVFRKSPQVRDSYFERNLNFQTREIFPDQIRYRAHQKFFNPEWIQACEAQIPPPPMPTPYPFFLSNRLYQEMTYETSPPTLWSEALSGIACGVKGIFPMASVRLFRKALSYPGTSKYENGFSKMILRRSTQGLLPDSSRLNPVKTGFNAPLDEWYLDPALTQETLDFLKASPLAKKNWLKPGALEEILLTHQRGENNFMMLIWPLINTAFFLQQLENSPKRP
ncbi:MAG: hypothetical protein LBF22_10890 [Deltaproteobacteria bacterium]|jgi:asparagine synthase (glutamine-hydrolysing)|nr:hypothetical protein [Deltaproteobacteria bacterium]